MLLVILGGNPGLQRAGRPRSSRDRLPKSRSSVYHGLYVDETADLCHWNVPDSHPLESWGDARAFDGTVTLIQPLIAPLYEGRSAHEVVSALAGQSGRSQLDIVKDYWTRAFAGQGWSFRDAEGKPFSSADHILEACASRRLHPRHVDRRRGTSHAVRAGARGGSGDTRDRGRNGRNRSTAGRSPSRAGTACAGSAIRHRKRALLPHRQHRRRGSRSSSGPIPTVWDGRFANNGWLQELPETADESHLGRHRLAAPVARRSSTACATATSIELRYRGNAARMPIFRVGGHPRQSRHGLLRLRPTEGGSRRQRRRHRRAVQSVPASARRTRPGSATGLEIAKTGDRHLIATTQEHHLMEGRNPGARRRPRGVPARAEDHRGDGREARPDADARARGRVHRLQVGHGDRPNVLHRLRGVHDGVRRGEQHPGRRQGAGLARPRDALDSRRSLLHGRSGARGHGAIRPPAGAVHAVRERAVRAGLPGGRDDAQHRRPERHGLQPLRRHALLLEQLPVQGPPLQLPALSGLGHARAC